jgi:pyridoxal phosphate enzyme (YggS family)
VTPPVGDELAAVHRRIANACAAAGRSPQEVTLLAVSKSHPPEAVCDAYGAGQRLFGENRVQELAAKAQQLADLPGLAWHMIGSLQTNKVRELLAVPGLVLLHSLDRVRLADELQRELQRTGRRLDVLVEVHVTDEPTKHGCAVDELPGLLDHVRTKCPALTPLGLMAMGPLDRDAVPVFTRTAALLRESRRITGLPMPVLSLGMSSDLEAAIASGSTLVRIGTDVFGGRG